MCFIMLVSIPRLKNSPSENASDQEKKSVTKKEKHQITEISELCSNLLVSIPRLKNTFRKR